MINNMPTLHLEIAGVRISVITTQNFLSYYMHTKFLNFMVSDEVKSIDYMIYVFPYRGSLGLDDLFIDVPLRYRIIDSYGIKGYVDTEQKRYIVHSPDDPNAAETILRIILSDLLLNEGGIMLHSSGVIDKERAFVFSGCSGAGKSTMASLSLPRTILNDEMIALRMIENNLICYSTPFSGSGKTSHLNISAPLKCLYLIEQYDNSEVLACKHNEAIAGIWKNIFSNRNDIESSKAVFNVVKEIVQRNMCRRLRFEKNEGVWDVINYDNEEN